MCEGVPSRECKDVGAGQLLAPYLLINSAISHLQGSPRPIVVGNTAVRRWGCSHRLNPTPIPDTRNACQKRDATCSTPIPDTRNACQKRDVTYSTNPNYHIIRYMPTYAVLWHSITLRC